MASRFRIQIIDTATGKTVEFEPGRSVELDLVEDIVARVVSKGVGFAHSTAHVAADVRAAIDESLFNLKSDVPRTKK